MVLKGLRYRFLLIFIGLAIGPILMVAMISGRVSFLPLESQNQEILQKTALYVTKSIDSYFKGVEKAFAIQAGREIRIAVMPDQIDDVAAAEISEQIARRIEQDLQYPGQIKVVVIRETRAVDFAR